MSTDDGALHHIFFFVETAPGNWDSTAFTSQRTSHSITESEFSDVDAQHVIMSPDVEHERTDSVVSLTGNVSGGLDQAAPQSENGLINPVDNPCAIVIPSIVIAGPSTNGNNECVDTSSDSDVQTAAQNMKLPLLSLASTVTNDKRDEVQSASSSSSKTSPLSVSAREFVPFGPALPPTPIITAAAAEFVPSVHVRAGATAPFKGKKNHKTKAMAMKPVDSFFEQRKTTEKGMGLFAIKKIPVGTRLISEPPLLQIRSNDLTSVLQAYHKLPLHKKIIYDSLHAYTPESLDLEQEIQLKVGFIDDEEILANNVKVMSIFSANDFILADQKSLGVFESASRINHSCIPNVHFSNNAELGCKETVHAARDIEEGEELLANYAGARANYQSAEQRRKYLFEHYGFVCDCKACSGALPESDARRLTLQYIVWGLNEWKYQEDEATLKLYEQNPYYPASQNAALAQAVDAISVLLAEGLVTSELSKAYRFASGFALELGQYEKALQYAFYERNIECNIFGKEVGDLKALGVASEQWITSIQLRMYENGARMPGDKFWVHFPEKKALWYDTRKMEKKRAAEEGEFELAEQKVFEQKREKCVKKQAERKNRDLEKLEAKESQKTQDQGEDKENVEEEGVAGTDSE